LALRLHIQAPQPDNPRPEAWSFPVDRLLPGRQLSLTATTCGLDHCVSA
jgi:hypothetical protein